MVLEVFRTVTGMRWLIKVRIGRSVEENREKCGSQPSLLEGIPDRAKVVWSCRKEKIIKIKDLKF